MDVQPDKQLVRDDPYGCDGLTEIYLGAHVTNTLPIGGQVRRGTATLVGGNLTITADVTPENFRLVIPMPPEADMSSVNNVILEGRFPRVEKNGPNPITCHAKYNISDKYVRVDSAQDPSLWFGVKFA